jgi:hypothetical protein
LPPHKDGGNGIEKQGGYFLSPAPQEEPQALGLGFVPLSSSPAPQALGLGLPPLPSSPAPQEAPQAVGFSLSLSPAPAPQEVAPAIDTNPAFITPWALLFNANPPPFSHAPNPFNLLINYSC